MCLRWFDHASPSAFSRRFSPGTSFLQVAGPCGAASFTASCARSPLHSTCELMGRRRRLWQLTGRRMPNPAPACSVPHPVPAGTSLVPGARMRFPCDRTLAASVQDTSEGSAPVRKFYERHALAAKWRGRCGLAAAPAIDLAHATFSVSGSVSGWQQLVSACPATQRADRDHQRCRGAHRARRACAVPAKKNGCYRMEYAPAPA